MKALVYSSYSGASALSVKAIPAPVPTLNQVLVKVAAASINKGDLVLLDGTTLAVRLAAGHPIGPNPDSVIGSDFAGVVHAVGANVTKFHVGDEVYGQVDFTTGRGSFAEFVCMSETDTMCLKPTNLTFVEAAAMPCAAQTALQTIRDDGGVKSGSKVVINGASGGVGSYAIQIAKALGAHVTAETHESWAPTSWWTVFRRTLSSNAKAKRTFTWTTWEIDRCEKIAGCWRNMARM
ncbi:hypothetical protein H310_09202 [Aphanomyces invadans]|uniref:Enoyl reductase (ER) domain-containing protein n=1 Tax=Aphanomyces invadans TaxID=157072 RepID=A0A024TUP0_9STRA|nr:hypothetical protein H310_09202 [Aphanomyces invadans]ETV97880.1 hypothetical protein H310_09202 [Aphanomyces invadans]|eukprot:XP_008873441.1 hypothetical protein H310_09202 [Aphanomyces invadans]